MTDLASLTIARAGELLRGRQISSLELVNAVLARIAQTEPWLHAYTQVLADEGRRAAHHADREAARGIWRGPLHGIPVAVKDIFYMRGISNEAGSRVLEGWIPAYTATAVRKLQDGGAIVIGKTETHEFAYGVNEPPTRNAWHREYYPGGSSAGSGAAVGARSAFAALGTDTGGSIREPAALNGVVGLKPTYGRVSKYGVVPLAPSLDHAGPLARTVLDTALVLGVIAGYDPLDSNSIKEVVPDYLPTVEMGAAGLTIGVDRHFSFSPAVNSGVRHAVERALGDLEKAGARLVEVRIPELELMHVIGLTILFPEASAVHRHWLRTKAAAYDPATRLMLELGELVPGTHLVQAQRARSIARQAVRNAFVAHGLDALAGPTAPTTTIRMDRMHEPVESGEEPLTAAIRTMFVANVTGLPALSVPCGFSAEGFPIGLELTGRPFREDTLLRLGRAYERLHEWTERMPPTISVSGPAPSS